jgi:UDPglucose 6-dehydrogenase
MITVIGLGFVGLTTGLGFSKKGFRTYGIDIDKSRLEKLRNFEIPFHEPGLKEVLTECYDKTFFLNASLEEAVKDSQVIFFCVGTPASDDGSADLSHLLNAIKQVLDINSDGYKVIVVKSTVPPSTLKEEVIPFVEKEASGSAGNYGFASNPEFLREGYCWEDFIEPDRIVIGAEDEKTKQVMEQIYKPFHAPIHFVTFNTAEFIKYLSNTLLSTMISYSNEMSVIADTIGNISTKDAFKILHEDKRWFGSPASMSGYVYPGCGYGGYCLPKDTHALYSIAKRKGFTPKVLGGNLDINEEIKDFVVKKITSLTKKNDTVGILGLSFKSGSDDIRLTPSLDIIEKLIDQGYDNILAYDPLAMENFKQDHSRLNIDYAGSLEETLEKADILVILTAWNEFKEKKSLLESKTTLDFRYIL